jgi:hypothetical protein
MARSTRRIRRALLRAGLIGASIPAIAMAGTAGLVNGEFDTDLDGWTQSGPPFPAWSMLDYQGNGASGSAVLANDSAEGGVRLYPVRQFVHLANPGSYRIEADGWLPQDHPGGRLVLSISGRAQADCSGGNNPAAGAFLDSNGSWQHAALTITIIAPFNYLDIGLGIEKDAAGGLLTGNVDGVHVVYREAIFADGFEARDQP